MSSSPDTQAPPAAPAAVLLMGNEAFARGAWEAGVRVASGYPGTPSTEILENLARYPDVYCEWAPNEKVAVEVAIGAALAGARALSTMKHIGLNVAADPLMTVAYTGVAGGLVLLVADDPGHHSSQNEQDTRHYARFAKIPILEPADAQEAKDFTARAFELSERFDTPVIVRGVTRVSHTKSIVIPGERRAPDRAPRFEKNPAKYIPVPAHGRRLHERAEERLARLAEFAEESDLNVAIPGSRALGIITSCVAYQYVREVFPEASVLKLGLSWPLPRRRIEEFAAGVKRLVVIEELDPFFETELRARGLRLEGKRFTPVVGELTPPVVRETRAKIEAEYGPVDGRRRSSKRARPAPEPPAPPQTAPAPAPGVPPRAPVLCPGCPHRGIFYALSRLDVIVTGDIGCYSLGFAPPFNRMDTIICMGASIGMMHGMEKAGLEKPVVAVIGDSTFLHSGVTGLMDVVYNHGAGTVLILDNRTTAMTGHQDHPATGRTLMGAEAPRVSFEALARACGVQRVTTIDPYDLDAALETLKREIAAPEPSVIIAERPCALMVEHSGRPYHIAEDACRACGRCLKLGCPALETLPPDEKGKKKARVNAALCAECGMCFEVCPFDAVSRESL